MCTGVVFDNTDSHKLPTLLSIYRRLSDEPFGDEHREVLRRLLAHMSRALGVMFHLRSLELKVAASRAAFDRLDSGVVLLDGSWQPSFINSAAQKLLHTGDVVRIGRSGSSDSGRLQLHPRLAAWMPRFEKMLKQAMAPITQDAEEHFSEALLLPEERGRPGCVVHVAPLAATLGLGADIPAARAILFFYDLQRASTVEPERLCNLFGLTPAEALAALQITQGGTTEEMAQRLSISPNTFKSQLKEAYAKSGTHRQVDMLKLLLALSSK